MGWWPFRRSAAGRHALGAAVTSLPSGPLVLRAPVDLAAPDDVASARRATERLTELLDRLGVEASSSAASLQGDDDGVERLSVPGGALVDRGPAPHDERRATEAAPEGERPGATTGEPAQSGTSAGEVDGLTWLSEALCWDDEDVLEPVPEQGPAPGPEPSPLEDRRALVVVPVQTPPPFVPAGPPLLDPALLAVGSVQLGFRDGSTASLDPEQSRALQDLARSLTSSGHPLGQ